MAADGTKTMNAKLSVKPEKEMKTDTKTWVMNDKDVKKIFSKPIVYQEKIDLNPKKWNEGKLAKAMEALVRTEMQLLANRVSDIKKKVPDAKSPKEHKTLLKSLEDALNDVVDRIQDKCSEALDELASGKGEAQAGIAMGKKAMAKLKGLSISKLFIGHGQTGLDSISKWATAEKSGDEKKVAKATSAAQKDIDDALKSLKETGKDAQNIAKYLLDTGKKLKGHDNGQLAAFGLSIMKKDMHSQLQKLDADMDKLEDVLTTYSDVLSKGKLDATNAPGFKKDFETIKSYQKSADAAVAAMKTLETQFKKIEKDLK